MARTGRERGADEGQMREFIRHLVACKGDESVAMRVTVGARMTTSYARQTVAGVAGAVTASPTLALD